MDGSRIRFGLDADTGESVPVRQRVLEVDDMGVDGSEHASLLDREVRGRGGRGPGVELGPGIEFGLGAELGPGAEFGFRTEFGFGAVGADQPHRLRDRAQSTQGRDIATGDQSHPGARQPRQHVDGRGRVRVHPRSLRVVLQRSEHSVEIEGDEQGIGGDELAQVHLGGGRQDRGELGRSSRHSAAPSGRWRYRRPSRPLRAGGRDRTGPPANPRPQRSAASAPPDRRGRWPRDCA